MLEQQAGRREVMKKALYVTPFILTLPAVPAFAAAGSGGKEEKPPKEKPPKEKLP
jgi:hypothetical protein